MATSLHRHDRKLPPPPSIRVRIRAADSVPDHAFGVRPAVGDAALPPAIPLGQTADPGLIDRIGAAQCLAHGILPLRRIGGATPVAMAEPADWPQLASLAGHDLGRVRPFLVERSQIDQAVLQIKGAELRLRAESRVDATASARSWPDSAIARALPPIAALMVGLVILAPMAMLAAALVWLACAMAATTALRGYALWHALQRPAHAAPVPSTVDPPLPVVSLLVPLYGEPDIAPRLVSRLARLDYPRRLLDVVLVLEERDHGTRQALDRLRLPGWMRIVVVPDGPIRTKPRALNFALDLCRGSVIGIYDAEDAPEADQIRKVVARFAASGPDLACLQGALDYYNPRTNAMARLFTAEYAGWFRVVMPALQRLGWPMPLGGTTLFLRRAAVESVGAWDAHNVTEDADLGVRLARHGLRTEMLGTTTREEANCRLRPWVRQRSRWIKGHVLTWAVHMRSPLALWRDLGPRAFLGYQLVFLGAQSQVLLAPLLWSFWLIPLGLTHPAQALLPGWMLGALVGLCLLSELLVMLTAATGLSLAGHRGLRRWVPLLHGYHMLGAVAGWKALHEAVANPFYWAKTSHGHFDLTEIPLPEIVTARSARERTRITLAKLDALADPASGQRTLTSPASIFSRVSKAREIWVRNAS